ncbi:putative glycosidase CRH2 [Coemansia erecta]|nr:putative glycosidase CRH2 [Coemansia erecta]
MALTLVYLGLFLFALGVSRAEGGFGVCLREIFFGQDVYGEPYTPYERVFARAQSPTRTHRYLLERDSADDGLQTIIAAGSGAIDLSQFFAAVNANNNNNNNNGGSSSSSSSSSISSSSHTTTTSASSQASSSSSSSSESMSASNSSEKASETTEVADPGAGSGVSGTYSQEPSDKAYTCKSEFVDFSKSDAMSKFSYVWCPENAQQSDNSVVWTLTQSCGTTMVYPWDFHQGRAEARIRIGAGAGVVTAMLLLGPAPSDEIDFEWVGQDTTHVQTMYYYQAHRVEAMPQVFGVSQQGNKDLSTSFQNYAIELLEDSIKWYLNGQLIRTLPKSNSYFPSDATRARMGIWNGSQTSGWAGTVDWGKGPFTAEMQWFNFTPYC